MVIDMKKECKDIFQSYNLPFKTFFVDCVSHEKTQHSDIELIWVLKGRATIETDKDRFTLLPETVFMVYMNEPHAIHAEKDTLVVSYRLDNEYLHERGLFFEKITFQQRVVSFEYLAKKYRQVPLLLVQLLKLLLSDDPREVIYHKIKAYYNFYVFELYSILSKEQFLDVKTIDYDIYLHRTNMIVEYIHDHCSEKITLNDLARLTDLSTFRVSHFIKEALGVSFKRFLNNVRFEKAVELLKESPKSVVDVAKDAGFSDYKRFNNTMKERFGKTPLKFRKENTTHADKPVLPIDNYSFILEIKQCLKNLEQDSRFQTLFNMNAFD
jgi:AraC-like DNA-binding protein